MPHPILRVRLLAALVLGLTGVGWSAGASAAVRPDSLPAGVDADITAPRFTYVPTDLVLGCAAAETFAHGRARAIDASGAPLAVGHYDVPLDGCGASRTILRTFTARDASGQTATAVQSIRVADETPPRFVDVPADTVLTFDDALPSAVVRAVDDCGGTAEVSFRDDYHGSDEGPMMTRTYTAVDLCGNVATYDQSVHFVEDAAALADIPQAGPPLAELSVDAAPRGTSGLGETTAAPTLGAGEPTPLGPAAATGAYIYVLSPFAIELSKFVRAEPR